MQNTSTKRVTITFLRAFVWQAGKTAVVSELALYEAYKAYCRFHAVDPWPLVNFQGGLTLAGGEREDGVWRGLKLAPIIWRFMGMTPALFCEEG